MDSCRPNVPFVVSCPFYINFRATQKASHLQINLFLLDSFCLYGLFADLPFFMSAHKFPGLKVILSFFYSFFLTGGILLFLSLNLTSLFFS